MENNNNRGNSNYQDNGSRAPQKGGRPFGSRPRIYRQGNRTPYNSNGGYSSTPNREGGFQGQDNGYSERPNNNYRPQNGGGNYGNQGYKKSYPKNNYYGNGPQRNNYGGRPGNNRNQDGGYAPYRGNNNNNYQGQGGYGYDRGGNNYGNPGYGQGNYQKRKPNYGKPGSKYTVDEKGYHHKKYWDHSDRKQRSFDAAVESEDDYIENDGKIRLNKFLSNSGMCSRREADRMIKAGMVQVNGETITEMGVKVNISDEVKYNGMIVKPEHKRYLLLNKPKDYITTLKDPHARNTVMELIEGACKERVYPVGRLDRNTTGVLLFTNDGDLAKKLTHPSNEVQKIYHVTLDKNVTKADLDKIAEGFDLEDGFINADEVGYANENSKAEVMVRIHSGRNRIVRRIFEALGYDVKKLDRIMFAGLDKKGLQRGRWRFLTEREVGFLNMISDRNKKDEEPKTEAQDQESETALED